jgi:limonene-1,2-epoxide hydrolase
LKCTSAIANSRRKWKIEKIEAQSKRWKMHQENITRRTLFAAGCLGPIVGRGLLGFTPSVEAATALSDNEKANLKRVQDFCGTWGAEDFDADEVMKEYLTPDCSVRVIHTQPFLSGPNAVAAAFKSYMPHGERVKVKFLFTYAKKPLVVTHRIDSVITPGKPDQNFEVVGVFLLKDGKIKEWTDYV